MLLQPDLALLPVKLWLLISINAFLIEIGKRIPALISDTGERV
jgi:hypothetical protein